MVSFVQTLVAAAAVAATALTAHVEALEVGDYFRPSGLLVSAVPGNTALYRRAPCPGLNTLANHGFLPRNGQNISRAVLSEALMSRYNLGADLTAALVSQVPDPFSLDFLSTHNFIEHDASLVHADAYYGRPPNEVNLILAADFLSRMNSEGRIGIPEVGQARKDRLAACLANNPQCDFGTAQSKNAFAEGAALIGAMGGRQNDSISVADATSFLVLEKFPSDFKKSADPITLVDLVTYSTKIAAYAV
ncbi:Chloroperoxidase, partial [Globisporangium splendens]